MSGKVRRLDYYPDEYISGVAGKLNAAEQGVYWMVCSLIMSEGGPIEYDERRLAGLCASRPADIRRIVSKLLEAGKISQSGGKLSQKRAQSEVELASNRIQTARENGSKGGRPSLKDKEIQQEPEAEGFSGEKLTTNYQLPTNNDHKEIRDEEDGLVSQAVHSWNALALKAGLATVQRLTKARRSAICARLRDGGPDGWQNVLSRVEASAFLKGENDRNWRVDFDFAVSERGYTKISEGHYQTLRSTGPPSHACRNGGGVLNALDRIIENERSDEAFPSYPDAGKGAH